MGKVIFKPETALYPLPVCLVTCGDFANSYNVITVAWTGTTNSSPPASYISIRPERYSYDLIKKSSEFVINLTTEELTFATDFCGVHSGANMNKFEKANLTPVPATNVAAPLIKESPVNIECKVKEIIHLGSHDMFLADIIAVNVNEELIKSNGKFNFVESNPICYSQGAYFSIGKELGRFAFSLSSPKAL